MPLLPQAAATQLAQSLPLLPTAWCLSPARMHVLSATKEWAALVLAPSLWLVDLSRLVQRPQPTLAPTPWSAASSATCSLVQAQLSHVAPPPSLPAPSVWRGACPAHAQPCACMHAHSNLVQSLSRPATCSHHGRHCLFLAPAISVQEPARAPPVPAPWETSLCQQLVHARLHHLPASRQCRLCPTVPTGLMPARVQSAGRPALAFVPTASSAALLLAALKAAGCRFQAAAILHVSAAGGMTFASTVRAYSVLCILFPALAHGPTTVVGVHTPGCA